MKVENIKSLEDAAKYCKGMIDDYHNGEADYEETLSALSKYTIRIMEIFYENAKIKSNGKPITTDNLYEIYKTYPQNNEVSNDESAQHVQYNISSRKLKIGFDHKLQDLVEQFSR